MHTSCLALHTSDFVHTHFALKRAIGLCQTSLQNTALSPSYGKLFFAESHICLLALDVLPHHGFNMCTILVLYEYISFDCKESLVWSTRSCTRATRGCLRHQRHSLTGSSCGVKGVSSVLAECFRRCICSASAAWHKAHDRLALSVRSRV